jgi:hypothetical protein
VAALFAKVSVSVRRVWSVSARSFALTKLASKKAGKYYTCDLSEEFQRKKREQSGKDSHMKVLSRRAEIQYGRR